MQCNPAVTRFRCGSASPHCLPGPGRQMGQCWRCVGFTSRSYRDDRTAADGTAVALTRRRMATSPRDCTCVPVTWDR
jgi:hypothetical protein